MTSVRNMLGYTGTYKGVPVSVMASGMGMPSIGIYSYELFKFYGVENIIRIGSAGSYREWLNVMDVTLAKDSVSESSYAKVLKDPDYKRKMAMMVEVPTANITAMENRALVKGMARLTALMAYSLTPRETIRPSTIE